MADPIPFPPRPIGQMTKQEKFDNPVRALALAPITIESIVSGGKHNRPMYFSIRVDENEHRIISAIRDRYKDRMGEYVSDQDVFRGMVREMGRVLVDSGQLDESENIALLRELSNLFRIRAQALEETRQQDGELQTIETITRTVTGFVAEKRYAKAYKSVRDFLDLLTEKVVESPEDAGWFLGKVLAQEGFVDAVEKLQAQGYEIAIPVLPA